MSALPPDVPKCAHGCRPYAEYAQPRKPLVMCCNEVGLPLGLSTSGQTVNHRVSLIRGEEAGYDANKRSGESQHDHRRSSGAPMYPQLPSGGGEHCAWHEQQKRQDRHSRQSVHASPNVRVERPPSGRNKALRAQNCRGARSASVVESMGRSNAWLGVRPYFHATRDVFKDGLETRSEQEKANRKRGISHGTCDAARHTTQSRPAP